MQMKIQGIVLDGARTTIVHVPSASPVCSPTRRPALQQDPPPAVPVRLPQLPLLSPTHGGPQDGLRWLRGAKQFLWRPRSRLLVWLVLVAPGGGECGRGASTSGLALSCLPRHLQLLRGQLPAAQTGVVPNQPACPRGQHAGLRFGSPLPDPHPCGRASGGGSLGT